MFWIRVFLLITISFTGLANLAYASEESNKIKVVNSSSWPPFSFIGEDGQPKGILYDLWTELGMQQGVDVEFINTNWNNTLDMMRNGDADVHAGLFRSKDRDTYLDFSVPIRIPIATRLFVSTNLNIDGLYEVGNIEVGVIRGGFSEGFINKNYSAVTTKPYPGTTALLNAAMAGEVKAFASDYAAAMYYLHKNGQPTAFSAVETLYMERLRAAVPKGDASQLALINKALSELPDEDFDRIVNKWIQSDSQLPHWVVPSFLLSIALLTLIFILFYIVMLKRQVRSQTLELRALSETDSLTGLYNRKKFEHCFECELRRYKLYKEAFSLILIDVDNFKQVNDTYGHAIGDETLLILVDILKNNIRQSDMLARWGGDEFTILCANTDRQSAIVQAKKLQRLIVEHTFPAIEKCTISIGIAEVKEQDQTNDIFIRADKALYKSKEEGKNTITCLPL